MQITFSEEKIKMIKDFIEAWNGFSGKDVVLRTHKKHRRIRDGGYLYLQPSESGDDVDLCMVSPSKRFLLNTKNFSERSFFCADFKDLKSLRSKNIIEGYLDTENSEIVFTEKRVKSEKIIKCPLIVSEEIDIRRIASIVNTHANQKEIYQCEVEKADLQSLETLKDLDAYFQKSENGELEIVQKESWAFKDKNSAECRINTEIPVKDNFLEFGFFVGDFLPLMSFFGEKIKFSLIGDKGKDRVRWISFVFDEFMLITPSLDSPLTKNSQ